MRKIVRLAYVLTLLILFDLTATIYWIANDLALEANPIILLCLNLVYISVFVYHLWGLLFLLLATN